MGRVRDARGSSTGAHRPKARRRDGRTVPSGMKGRGFHQDIHTPELVAELVYDVLGGIPDLDPFASPLQVLRAKTLICHPRTRCERSIVHEGAKLVFGDGFTILWWGNVYLNPEFEQLGEALERTWREVHREGGAFQALLLGPIRTHRSYAPWFWAANACCFMRPIAFEGWEHQFSMPLGLSYFGPRVEHFRHHARRLGVVRRLTPWTKRIIMPPMSDGTNLAAELEERRKAIILDLARDNPQMSIMGILDQLSLTLESDEAKVLLCAALGSLVSTETMVDTVELGFAERADAKASRKASRKGKRKAPTNRSDEPKAKAAKATKPAKPAKAAKAAKANGRTNGHARGGKESQVPEKLGKFLGHFKKGDQFKTSDAIVAAGVGRAATIKHLEAFGGKICMRGAGRGAFWEVR